jgi:hypothetical protein
MKKRSCKNAFRPVVVAKRQPLPEVIRSPLFALLPLMTISFGISTSAQKEIHVCNYAPAQSSER